MPRAGGIRPSHRPRQREPCTPTSPQVDPRRGRADRRRPRRDAGRVPPGVARTRTAAQDRARRRRHRRLPRRPGSCCPRWASSTRAYFPTATETLAQLGRGRARPRVLAQRRPHADGVGARPAHRDGARHRARHDHRAGAVPAPCDPHDGRVPAADPVGRAHPARDPDVRLSAAGGAPDHRVRELLAGVHPGALRRRRRRCRRPRHGTQLRALARVAHRQPRLPHGAAVPHDRASAWPRRSR